MKKMPTNPNYYPNYYGRSRSQFLTPESESWRIRTVIYSRKETTRRRSAYKKRRGKRISIQTGPENMKKNASEPQMTTAASKVNSRPQEAKVGSLEPPSPQEKKPQGGAPLTRREEENEFPFEQVQKESVKNGSYHKRSSSRKCTNYCRSPSSSKLLNNNACNYCQSIPSRTAKKKTWQRYGKSKRICATEPDSNAPDRPKPDSNSADRPSQSDFYTPTVTACWPDINITPLKGEDDSCLLIDVANKKCFPVID